MVCAPFRLRIVLYNLRVFIDPVDHDTQKK